MEAARGKVGIKLPARASMWYVLSSVIARGAGVVGTPIFTRLLSPEEYGLYPIYSSWLGIIGSVATLEMTGGVVHRALQKYGGRRDEVISAALGLCLVTASATSLVYALLPRQINALTGLGTGTMALLLAQVFVNIPLSLYTAECRFAYRYTGVVAINLASAILTPSVSILLIRVSSLGGMARIVGTLAVGILTSLPALMRILSRSRVLVSREIWGYMLRTALPLLPHYLSVSLILRIGEIAVDRGFGPEEMGKYAVATSLGLGLCVLSSGLSSALNPWILRKLGENAEERISELLLLLTEGLCLVTLLLLCYAPEAIAVIAPREYADALPAVYPIAVSMPAMLLSGAISSCQLYRERGAATSLASLVATGVGIIAAHTAVRIGDYRLASLSLPLSYLTMTAISALDYRWRVGRTPIKMGATCAVTALLCLGGAAALLLKDSLPARIFLSMPLAPPLLSVARRAMAEIRE